MDPIRRKLLKTGAAAAAMAATPGALFARQGGNDDGGRFYERGNVRIRYEETGSGFPLLLISGGGLNGSTIAGIRRGNPFNTIEAFSGEFRCIYADLRHAAGQSTGPLEVDRPWDAYTDDHLGLMDHLGIDRFMVLGFCSRRRWAAAESRAIGYGGDAVVSSATGLARETIRKGRGEIARDEAPTDRIRRPGGGRPRIQQDQPGIQAALEALVDPLTRGDPTSPLRWTCKSRAKLAAALTEQGWRVSSTTVGRLLHRLGYRLQSPRKRQEGATHPDRNAQFEHINRTADEHLRAGQPVISVDTKKKELVGNFKNGGREWQPKGTPPAVLVHDFPTDAEGKAIPYGVYDMARNEAWVSVGWDHDTPAFAVASIRQWWRQMGCDAYPDATTLFITADAGGSNGYRLHAWKHELQQLADETGLTIEVSHFPPGTSKWNKIEHRGVSDRRQGDQGADGGTRAGPR